MSDVLRKIMGGHPTQKRYDGGNKDADIHMKFDDWIQTIKSRYGDRSKIISSGIILGHLPRLENNRDPRMIKGRVVYVKSKEAQNYEKHGIPQIRVYSRRLRERPLNEFIDVFLRVYCRTSVLKGNSQDLNGELFYNCLEKSGMIDDDRLIVGKHLRRMFDKKNPRVEFCITTPYEDFG